LRCGPQGLRRRIAPASAIAIEAALVGVFDLTKIGSQAWTAGAKVYWDNTNKRSTTVATDNTLIGVATEAVASGAGDTISRVRLNASF
jgi:predicted RecA/RadA family phage recombinase